MRHIAKRKYRSAPQQSTRAKLEKSYFQWCNTLHEQALSEITHHISKNIQCAKKTECRGESKLMEVGQKAQGQQYKTPHDHHQQLSGMKSNRHIREQTCNAD
mmetsp:Transcript_11766/g.22775  ORF Transcript_11766/g.22775 Transcript_11766/m.22775 type:complete len:102 (+) Transcript_11766:642-947(+)